MDEEEEGFELPGSSSSVLNRCGGQGAVSRCREGQEVAEGPGLSWGCSGSCGSRPGGTHLAGSSVWVQAHAVPLPALLN